MSHAKPQVRLRKDDELGPPGTDDKNGIARFGMVGEGDNPGAHALVAKGRQALAKFRAWAGEGTAASPESAWVDACDSYLKAIEAAVTGPSDDEGAKIKAATDAFVKTAKSIAGLKVDTAALDSLSGLTARVPGCWPADDRAAFVKALTELQIVPEETDAMADVKKTDTPAAPAPAPAPATAAKMTLEEAMAMVPEEARATIEAAMGQPKAEPEEEPVEMTAKQKAAYEAVKAEAAAAKAAAAKANEEVEKMKAAQEKAALETKIKALPVAIDLEKGVAALKGDGKAAEEVINGLAAQIEKHAVMLRRIGHSGSTTVSDVAKRYDDAIKAIVKEKGVTKEQATVLLVDQDPDLVEEYREDQLSAA